MGEKEKMSVEVKKGKCKLRRRSGGGVEEVALRRSELKNSTQGETIEEEVHEEKGGVGAGGGCLSGEEKVMGLRSRGMQRSRNGFMKEKAEV